MKRIQFIFVAGVEGCGHHGLAPVLVEALKHKAQRSSASVKVVLRHPRIRTLLNRYWPKEGTHTVLPRWLTRLQIRILILALTIKAFLQRQRLVLIEDCSFPDAGRRSVDSQWRISELLELVTPLARSLVIGLFRDPRAMAYSHKNWDGGLRGHALVVRKYVEFLNQELSQMDASCLTIISYEQLIENSRSVQSRLGQLLDLDEKDLQFGYEELKPSRKNWRTELEKPDRDWLIQTFKGIPQGPYSAPFTENAVADSDQDAATAL